MNESSYLNLIPVLFILLVVTMPTVIYFFVKKVKKFTRTLFIYIFISMLIILIFSFIYMLVFTLDLQNLNQHYPNGLSTLKEPEKQEVLSKFLHFKGINILDYKGNYISLFLDLIYFSSMTFFTVGYGDITVSGIVRIIPILESVLGVAMTGIIISMILSDSIELSKKEDELRMFIFRGYDILCFEKTSIKDFGFLSIFSESLYRRKFENDNKNMYNVYLIDSNCKVATIFYVNLDNNTKDMFENFKIIWDFTNYRNHNIEYYYKFVQYLRYQFMGKLEVQLEAELCKFINTNKKIDLLEVKQFLINLKNSFINTPIDKRELDNEIFYYITQCINSIEKKEDEI